MKPIKESFFKKRQGKRNYLHFDKKRSPAYLCNYIANPANIIKHSFYPFISYNLVEKKVTQGYIPLRKRPTHPLFTLVQTHPKVIHHHLYPFISYKKAKIYAVPKIKTRLISYASHFDSDIYAYYANLLTPSYEAYLVANSLQDTVLAYRKIVRTINGEEISKCNIHFSKDVFDDIARRGNCVVLCYDISKFFDTLSHVILKGNWCKVLGEKRLSEDHYKVYKTLTKFAAVDKNSLYRELGFSLNSRTLHKRYDVLCSSKKFRDRVRGKGLVRTNKLAKGIPQGSPLSGLLSNIYMMDFDKKVNKYVQEIDGEYYRYSDDMIFVINAEHEDGFKDFIKTEILKLKIELNSDKTQRVVFKNGFVDFDINKVNFNNPTKLQYLGVLYDGEQVFLRDTGLSRYNYKIRKAIRMRSAHYRRLKKNENLKELNIYKRKLHCRFTYIGKRNYISYALRVSAVHHSNSVKRQVKGHYKLFNNYLNARI